MPRSTLHEANRIKNSSDVLEKNANVTNHIRKLIYTPNSIRIGQWESVQNWKEMGHNCEARNLNKKNVITKLIYIASFIRIGQWESVQTREAREGEFRKNMQTSQMAY